MNNKIVAGKIVQTNITRVKKKILKLFMKSTCNKITPTFSHRTQ